MISLDVGQAASPTLPKEMTVHRADSDSAIGQMTVSRDSPVAIDMDALDRKLGHVAAEGSHSQIELIPIESIHVVNPRERNKKKFQQIVANISRIGLKRPITVRKRPDGEYDLVCGQGRLEAFRQLNETMVPAIIRDISSEDALLMSLVENLARRRPSTMETIRALVLLRDRGYSHSEIGRKTGIVASSVTSMLVLYDRGEEHLLNAVEAGRVSLASAILISRSPNTEVQAALTRAMEEKKITPGELKRARRLADRRDAFGLSGRGTGKKNRPDITPESIVRTFRREQERQRQALKKAELCEAKLVFTISALRMLFRDENFINLLRAEGLETLPDYIAEHIKKGDNNG
ncbi:MAG: ParB N-terminal domain-containing protein [Candidatus Marsarchaeota archaeon]|nr:ParB N-terminal domain-containing protein [Candidatus Marsarchaeota archaeon]